MKYTVRINNREYEVEINAGKVTLLGIVDVLPEGLKSACPVSTNDSLAGSSEPQAKQ